MPDALNLTETLIMRYRIPVVTAALWASWGARPASAGNPFPELPCEELRLDGPGEVFENYEFQSQGDIGNCYAFMSAKLLDAWRYSNPLGGRSADRRQSSGLALSMAISSADPLADDLNGAFGCEAVLQAFNLGGCDKDVVLPRFRNPEGLATPIARLLRQHGRYQGAREAEIARRADRASARTCRVASRSLRDELEPGMTDVLAALDEPTGVRMVARLLLGDACENPANQLQAGTPYQDPAAMMDPCRQGLVEATVPRRNPRLSPAESERAAQLATLGAIDRALGEGKPAGLELCSTVIRHPGSTGVNWTGVGSSSNYAADLSTCDPHAAPVIGRRRVGNRCQYLLFNSWEGSPGDLGKTWIDADDLARNTLSVLRIRN